MTYFPLGEEMSITVLYGFAKDSLLSSGRFAVNRGDKLILDTIFDTFTYVVKDIGAIEETDTDYRKRQSKRACFAVFYTKAIKAVLCLCRT